MPEWPTYIFNILKNLFDLIPLYKGLIIVHSPKKNDKKKGNNNMELSM